MFPLLTTLELSGRRLEGENLQNLPPGLTTLVIAAYGEDIKTPNLFGNLPRGITRLELWFCVEDQQEDGNELPPNLTELNISQLETSFNWLKKVPRSVTKMAFSMSATVEWEYLPAELKELEMSYPSQMPSSAFSLLPQSLRVLRVWVEGGLKDSDMALLPRSLTTLIDYTANISHEGLQLAPPAMTELSVKVKVTHPDIFSFYHPESVDIRLTRNAGNGDENPIILKPLPLPLTLVYFTIPYMTDDVCLILPPLLEVLDIAGGHVTSNGAKIFRSLKHLRSFTSSLDAIQDDVIPFINHIYAVTFKAEQRLQRDRIRLSPNFFQLLLPSTPSDLISSPCIPQCHSSPLSSAITISDDAELIPLSRLYLEFDEFEDAPTFLPKQIFRSFSELKNLDTISISSHWHNIKSSWMKYFPPSLRSLSLGLLAAFPDARHLGYLPPGLTSLELEIRTGVKHQTYTATGNIGWTDQDLSYLPRNLGSLRINGKLNKLTADLNQYTPPYLAEFRVAWSDFHHFTSPLTRAFGPDPREEPLRTYDGHSTPTSEANSESDLGEPLTTATHDWSPAGDFLQDDVEFIFPEY
jgi:hypothetical protein